MASLNNKECFVCRKLVFFTPQKKSKKLRKKTISKGFPDKSEKLLGVQRGAYRQSAMTSFNIDNWMNDIKNAFISTLEKSEVPLSYIEIAKKLKLNQHDDKNWFARSVISELFDEDQVEKVMKRGKTKYTITGRVYVDVPEALEDMSAWDLKTRCVALGVSTGQVNHRAGSKAELVRRLKAHELGLRIAAA